QGVGQDPRRARRVGRRVGQQVPAAQRPALVRAAVADAIEAVTYPEHANRPAPGLDDPALARGGLADRSHYHSHLPSPHASVSLVATVVINTVARPSNRRAMLLVYWPNSLADVSISFIRANQESI